MTHQHYHQGDTMKHTRTWTIREANGETYRHRIIEADYQTALDTKLAALADNVAFSNTHDCGTAYHDASPLTETAIRIWRETDGNVDVLRDWHYAATGLLLEPVVVPLADGAAVAIVDWGCSPEDAEAGLIRLLMCDVFMTEAERWDDDANQWVSADEEFEHESFFLPADIDS